MEKPLKIAIIGGGIGGLSAALSIHHLLQSRVSICVYEKCSAYKEIGAGIDIAPNACTVLSKIDLFTPMSRISAKVAPVWVKLRRGDTGETVVELNHAMNGENLPFPSFKVLRNEALQVLYDAVKARGAAEMLVNKKCVSLGRRGDVIAVKFGDGTEAVADVILGADGIHSGVRETIFEDAAVFEGNVVFRGLVSGEKMHGIFPEGEEGIPGIWVGRKMSFVSYPVGHDNHTQNVAGIVPVSEDEAGKMKESWNGTTTREVFAEMFKDFEPAVQRIIAALPDKVMQWPLYDRNPYDNWIYENGQVTLLGDACHAVLPYQGQGASQAIEDSYAVALSLTAFMDNKEPISELRKYIQVYQDLRLPRATKIQQNSRLSGKITQQRLPVFEGKSQEEIYEHIRMLYSYGQINMNWIWDYDLEKEWKTKAFEAGILKQEVRC